MMAVLFEVTPRAEGRDEYLRLAAELAKDLAGVDGFLSIERFESLSRPGTLLSLSYWRDEAAVAAWRSHAPHRAAQARGKASLFEHYLIRVAVVVR